VWVCAEDATGCDLETGFGDVGEDDLCAAFASERDGCCCADAWFVSGFVAWSLRIEHGLLFFLWLQEAKIDVRWNNVE